MLPRHLEFCGSELGDLKEAGFPLETMSHRENGGTLGMVPLIINPRYILYSGYLLGIYPFTFTGLLGGVKQLGYHPKGTTSFLMNVYILFLSFLAIPGICQRCFMNQT